ncbi:IclR family transcriptional regulator [Amycolatopsis pithecellobii]|uniref:Helix-turn-helix domain-containing protein n=1 Tax=Amycolatopsis pithecellobii TaxID=664692 RepID=A0A6N7YU84_9PSEU|nr:IclR family transcriptional regulator [Amycolatopsis pithecellobii]MTD55492.1 helix-turn-helix domain-containing protein [Amycolatopsis pithecellobii]
MSGATLSSAQKALRALKALQRTPSLSVTEVAHLLDVSPSSAHRVLATLVAEGFVRQQDDGRRYEAGHGLIDIALTAVSHVKLRRLAHRHLQELSDHLPAQVWLIHLDLPRALSWDLCWSTAAVLATPDVVSSRPLHSLASGKVLLSALSQKDLDRLYPEDHLPVCAKRTIASKHGLTRELTLVRQFGYAVQVDESLDGTSAVAVPIYSGNGDVIAALAVTGPTSDYTRSAALQRVRLARRTADRICLDLSGTSPDSAPAPAEG